MQKTELITCINCPMGCRMEVTLEDGAVISVKGNTCKRGETYAHQECTQPLRMITAVAPVKNSAAPVSLKTRTPIPKAKITDTRKTLPGLRRLQKYAVTVGGGFNHRYNLSEGAMLKDNHVDAYGGIVPAVTALRGKIGHMTKIEVEVRDLDELAQALSVGCEIIMLDNMSCEDMTKAVEITAGRAMLEASGNVTEENIAQIAKTGVDIISLGALTHSVKCFDISMRFEK